MYHISYFVSTSVSDQPQHKLLIPDNEKDNIKCTWRNKVSIRMEGVMEPSAYEPTLYPE